MAAVHPQHAPFELAPHKDGNSLLGDALRSQVLVKILSVLVTFLAPNLIMLAALGCICAGAWLAGPIPGLFVTGGALLVLDLKLRG